jgi:uncharacterized protein (TIGR02611 family)
MVTKHSSMEHIAVVSGGEDAVGQAGTIDAGEDRGNDVPQDERAGHGQTRTPRPPAATGGTAAVNPARPGPRQRLRITLELIRANPAGRIVLKVFVAVAGALVVAFGVALIPLPGPGWLIVIGGLGVWAVEFQWAKQLLAFTRRSVQAWSRWVVQRSWPVRVMLGAVGLVVGVAVVLSMKYSMGIDLIARALAYLTAR